MGTQDCNPTVDDTYEFAAPKFFDFLNGETDEEMKIAEHWFITSLSYAPSPFMPKIREGRHVKIDTLCDFGDVERIEKGEALSEVGTATSQPIEGATLDSSATVGATSTAEMDNSVRCLTRAGASSNSREEDAISQGEEEKRIGTSSKVTLDKKPCGNKETDRTREKQRSTEEALVNNGAEKDKMHYSVQGPEVCTPEPQILRKKTDGLSGSKRNQTANRLASSLRNPSSRKPNNQSHLLQTRCSKPPNPRSTMTAKKTVASTDFAQENQAIKRQKLEGGKSREILNVKPQNLPHNKSSLGLASGVTKPSCSNSKSHKEERKLYVREVAVPFVSTAEMVKRFQSSTREENGTLLSQKPKLTLTRPKEPDLETSNRARFTKVKSSIELEEEMMANMPKFKARAVNKKIFEAPTVLALPRSTPQPPEFQEFHFKTMERASQNSETSSVVSTESSSHQNQWNPHKLTTPRLPHLETLVRARPPTIKSTQEMEQEELEKMPKFKARPLNKKIFESKGGLGIFRIAKGHVTKPQEFHFATDERIPPSKSVTDLFDKLSLFSESCNDHPIPRLTTPNPFHLNTEERGAQKERKFVLEIMQKQLEEEQARVPRATPYPYTTDYPVIPPKPQPKHCTKPEPFQLESLVRHEDEMQREMEKRHRLEREEVELRKFKAQPILREDPLPVPEKERLPLTQVEEFVLHVNHRAVDRAEFDGKIKEKEVMYKRYREEHESAKMMEEEKALKQLRRTLVHHARPVPKFDNPFHPQKSSNEPTKPISPKLRVLQRRPGRKSAAASNMR